MPRKRVNLIGQSFGSMTVIDFDTDTNTWKCKCICGKEKFISTSPLKSKSKKCNCRVDLTGRLFGKLRVIKCIKQNSVQNQSQWECICECGELSYKRQDHLLRGESFSCGCKNRQFNDLTGLHFNKLTVIEYAHKKNKKHYWECLCKCGNKTIVEHSCLRFNHVQSCGCLLTEVLVKRNFKHGLNAGKRYNPEYEKFRRKNTQGYALKKSVRCMIYRSLKENKIIGVWRHLPYTLEELKKHLENQFEDWMTWDNYGEWHLDHIIPQSSFKFTNMQQEEFLKCWSLSNLRPLSKIENLKKGSKLI